MKKLSLVAVFFLSVSLYGKNIPTPFWYKISEKILSEANQLISPEDEPAKPAPKVKKVKATKLPCELNCNAKAGNVLPTPFITINSDGIWTVSE
jgi:hypothetical protein